MQKAPLQVITFPAEGTYAVTAIATDAAGNQTTVIRNIIYAKLGDVNDSGDVDITDALRALRYYIGTTGLTDIEKARCDVAPLGADGRPNPNGVVDIGDVVLIMRRIVGLVSW